VDGGLNRGLSNAGIASAFEAAGGKLDPDVIARHRNAHWVKPVAPDAPKPTKRDLAIMVRDKVADALVDMPGEGILLMGKELAPAINAGLKAEAALDKREALDKKLMVTAGLPAFLQMMEDERLARRQLEDGNTIEGEYSEAD
jgi:hypothetical protein